MKLGTLLFLGYVGIFLLCFSVPAAVIAKRVRIVYLESAEEPLVDTANILAELAGQAFEQDAFDPEHLYRTFDNIGARTLSARIYEITKQHVDLDVYITDARGVIVFDSRGREMLGRDYSRWRDVSLTLAGKYGARVSGGGPGSSLPRALHVAAPVFAHGQIAGVLTVVKPTTAVKTFLQAVNPQLVAYGLLAVAAAVVLALVLSLWLTQQVHRLTRYAEDVRKGARVPFPKLARTELRDMGLAFEKMRESLAGQAYVEQYVRALTHEIKSPISAIRGAAEILETPALEPTQRGRFLRNIQHETERVQDLVDRMLELSELEVRRALPRSARVALAPILRTIVESQEPVLSRKHVRVELEAPEALAIPGDEFLLHLALSNLIKNAIEFSPDGGLIRVRCEHDAGEARISVDDSGPGIPDFAKQRVFERFYSLERPDTGRRSTGLGLNFVNEVASLHHGRIELENREQGGLRALLSLPTE